MRIKKCAVNLIAFLSESLTVGNQSDDDDKIQYYDYYLCLIQFLIFLKCKCTSTKQVNKISIITSLIFAFSLSLYKYIVHTLQYEYQPMLQSKTLHNLFDLQLMILIHP